MASLVVYVVQCSLQIRHILGNDLPKQTKIYALVVVDDAIARTVFSRDMALSSSRRLLRKDFPAVCRIRHKGKFTEVMHFVGTVIP